MFSAFGENRLERVNSTTPALKLSEWKMSDKTRAAYEEIFTNSELLSKIGYSVFKQYKEESLPKMHCAYILSICDILLNPRSSGIKCNDKSVIRRINAFLVNIRSTVQKILLNILQVLILLINSGLLKIKNLLLRK